MFWQQRWEKEEEKERGVEAEIVFFIMIFVMMVRVEGIIMMEITGQYDKNGMKGETVITMTI